MADFPFIRHTKAEYLGFSAVQDPCRTIEKIETRWENGEAVTRIFDGTGAHFTPAEPKAPICQMHLGDYDYLLYLPERYEERDAWPVIFFFHGIGERGDDPQTLLRRGLPQFLQEGLRLDAIVIAPQCPLESHWADTDLEVEVHLRRFLPLMLETYRIDRNRVYATGLSMGGRCTWKLVLAMPEYFAAAAVVCGRTNTFEMERLREIPIWMIHGVQDSIVSFENVAPILEALKNAGHPDYRLTVYPYLDHDVWTSTYEDPAFYEWLLSQRKK